VVCVVGMSQFVIATPGLSCDQCQASFQLQHPVPSTSTNAGWARAEPPPPAHHMLQPVLCLTHPVFACRPHHLCKKY
jgi:hypothetical protein